MHPAFGFLCVRHVGRHRAGPRALRYPVEAACAFPPSSGLDRSPGTTALVDAVPAFRAAVTVAAAHATASVACRAIDAEVADTSRRLRAISERWLPAIERQLRELTERLDENERAETRDCDGSCAGATGRVVTMISNVVLAVEDSPGSLRAARLGIEIARACGARVRAITVVADHDLGRRVADGDQELRRTADSVLAHVTALATAADVALHTVELDGEPAQRVLEQARDWPTDLIVVGRCREPGVGRPSCPCPGVPCVQERCEELRT
jgi:nucleotide-binding universal stress UspA family protein